MGLDSLLSIRPLLDEQVLRANHQQYNQLNWISLIYYHIAANYWIPQLSYSLDLIDACLITKMLHTNQAKIDQ